MSLSFDLCFIVLIIKGIHFVCLYYFIKNKYFVNSYFLADTGKSTLIIAYCFKLLFSLLILSIVSALRTFLQSLEVAQDKDYFHIKCLEQNLVLFHLFLQTFHQNTKSSVSLHFPHKVKLSTTTAILLHILSPTQSKMSMSFTKAPPTRECCPLSG